MIYLIRHGETQANRDHKYLGSSQSPLTLVGSEQHGKVVRMLDGIHLDRIFSSPSKRCKVLAHELAKQYKLSVVSDPRLQEINFGIFEQLTYEQAKSLYPEEWVRWEQCDGAYALPKGESTDVFERRVADFAQTLQDTDDTRNVAVVTHGGVVTSLLCNLLEMDIGLKWRFRANNGAILKVCFSDGFAYLDM